MKMTRALAIETSGRIGSVAVVEDGAVLAEETFSHGLQNAARIVPAIDRLCRRRQWTPKDVRELYVSAGPGSFTGLRIGVTLAKTFALATGVKIVAVPTVRVLAENAPSEATHLIIVLDAKRDQIFTARLQRTADGWETREPAHLDSLAAMIARSPRPVYLLGEGIPYHEKFIQSADRDATALERAASLTIQAEADAVASTADSGVFITPADAWRARAEAVAKLGHAMARAGEFSDPDRLAPIYIRRPEAEEKADELARLNAKPE
jgi:tRNA threonylcarbamoyl adenosine modification protein YeaZ